MKTYTGTVVFPCNDEPYDAGHGPSYNVKVKIDQPGAPRTGEGKNKPGETRVYAKEGTSKAAYMKTLRSGDPIVLALMERGDNQWYDFVTDADVMPSKSASTDKQEKGVYTKDEIWPTYENTRDIFLAMYSDVETKLASNATGDDIARIAITLFINTMRSPKLPVEKKDAPNREEVIYDQWDGNAANLLNLIAEHEDAYDGTEMIGIVLKGLGIRSANVKNGEDALAAALAAWEVADLLNQGADLEPAITIVKEQMGKTDGSDNIPW
jgi:hypothetical protein